MISFVIVAAVGGCVATQPATSATDLWKNNCLNCHGENGQGGGAGTQTLLGDHKGGNPGLADGGMELDRRYFDAIKKGVPDRGMDAFGATMKDEQIWALVVHIRELQAKERRGRVGWQIPATKPGSVAKTKYLSYTVETVVPESEKLDVPWAVDWLPDGKMLVTERPGRLRVWDGKKLSPAVTGLPKVTAGGQGGLMDVAVHPDSATTGVGNGWVYLAYVEAADTGKNEMTKIVRGKVKPAKDGWAWSDEQTIFQARQEHYLGQGVHYGCRIVFQKAEGAAAPQAKGRRYVYFGIGERGHGEMAQDLSRPNGKIHRVWDDGEVPSDNPFVSRGKETYTSIWSYGHRNPQGLAFDLGGRLWDTEHGPRGGDETNLILKGRNYGWPKVSFGINYSDAPFRTPWPSGKLADGGDDDILMPADRWLPSIGACGLDCVRGGAFDQWRGDLLAGGLSGANVDRIRTKDGKVIEREEIFHGWGRVRDVACGPDGFIYIVLNDPHKIVRMVPAPAPAAAADKK